MERLWRGPKRPEEATRHREDRDATSAGRCYDAARRIQEDKSDFRLYLEGNKMLYTLERQRGCMGPRDRGGNIKYQNSSDS